MRRKDREMGLCFAHKVIDESRFGVLSVSDGNSFTPYSIPLSLVRCEDFLYFHTAMEGHKIELLSLHDQVRVVFVGNVQVPELFTNDQLDEMVRNKEQAIRLISSVFTTEYESAIVEGHVAEVADKDEKTFALKLICEKYTPDKMAYFDHALKAGLQRTKIFRIEMETVTAKRKKYDENGNEIKWGNE